MRNAYTILVGELKETRPQGRNRRTSDDDMKMDLKQIGCERVDCIHMTRGTVQ